MLRSVAKKYDKMYANRSYYHWYLGEGMENGAFIVNREHLEYIMREYDDAAKEEESFGGGGGGGTSSDDE